MSNTSTNNPETVEDVENAQIVPKKTPMAQVWTLMTLNSVISFSFECIFPFVNQFLLEIGVIDDPADAGYYSGVTESAFAIAGLLTVFPATWISDIYGRKPVVITGAIGVGIAMTLFGLSTKWWMMIAARVLGGLEGGSMTSIRVMAYEMTTKADEGFVMMMIPTTYRLGQIIGQPVGGLLAHPERRWPRLFGGKFWKKYPFSLPCLVGAAYAFGCALVGILILKETLRRKDTKKRVPDEPQETTALLSEPESTFASALSHEVPSSASSSPTIKSVMTWPLFSLLISNASLVVMTEMFFAVYPLFAFTPIEIGGLGLSEARIGLHMSVRSVLHICTTLPYTKIEKKLGNMTMYRISMLAWLPTIMLFPVLNWIARGWAGGEGGFAWYATLLALFTIWSITGWTWTTVMLLLPGHTPNSESMATVQGLLSVSVVAPQTVGPVLGTAAFAVAMNHPNILNGNLFWVAAFIFASVAAAHSFTLVEVSNTWRVEQSEEETS